MDIIELLTADHNRFRGLISRFKEAETAGDAAAMTELGEELFTDVDVHARAEEAAFYEPLRSAVEELGEKVDEGEQEHHVADVLIAECRELEPASDDWIAKVAVLIENVEHHLTEEEDEMFPKARGALAADDLQNMGEDFERRKAERGAPTADDKMGRTKEELAQMARDQQIPGRSKMDHDELAATVRPD